MIYAGYTPKKSSDEQYTPAYAVAPIIKYIPENKIVWCPFDTEHSEYVLALKAAGIRVVHSHILTGEDFFVYEPEEWDLIVPILRSVSNRRLWNAALHSASRLRYCFPIFG